LTLRARCAVASQANHEPLFGTASTVTKFLLLEDPGPWGVDALRDARMPPALKQQLIRQSNEYGVRVLLIRRHGRATPGRLRCFAVTAGPGVRWVETTTLHEPADVLDLDLAALGAGRSLGLARHDHQLLLVCTHGRHDPCCAERGRPLAAALARSHPEQMWECSHIGGDRFAGNLVVLPDGWYYGRVEAADGPRIAAEHLAGRLDLQHLRGRVTSGFAVQAAEWHLRTKLDLTGVDAVRPLHASSRQRLVDAQFAVEGGQHWRVRVRVGRGPAEKLSCRDPELSRPPAYELLDIEPATSG